ncbi:siderophore ABC transporter substrate-binding protein [Oerskovia flava]|uniref:siderophore ABC transporter substrate-binding protein n=1 Tax=Oerskovia flava TaxID=2986422 RepID=UPI002240AAAA|nr:siderophore ABC transporter substrate-binding protein [Oerskovia sp. JB1-3-2]
MTSTARTLRTATTIAVVALIAGACGSATDGGSSAESTTDEQPAARTITVEHAQGSTEVPLEPQTVLTFDIASLTVLDAFGVEVAGVPKSNLPEQYAHYAADDVLDIGTLFEPDYEVVNAAEPDLIIVAGRSSEALPELSRIAPTIDLSNDWTDFRTSVVEGASTLGEIFDKEDEIADMVATLDTSIEEVAAAAPDAGNALILLTSAGEITAYGPGSRFGFLHDDLGVTPAVEDVEEATHGEAVSFEFVLDVDPDWLFVVDRDAATGEGTQSAEAVLDNEIIHRTSAWESGQVVYVDPVSWYIVNGGLPTLQQMTDEVAGALGTS